jgi:hypothetical protein
MFKINGRSVKSAFLALSAFVGVLNASPQALAGGSPPWDPHTHEQWYLGALHVPETWVRHFDNERHSIQVGLITDEQFRATNTNHDMPPHTVHLLGTRRRENSSEGEKLVTSAFAVRNNVQLTSGIINVDNMEIYSIPQERHETPYSGDLDHQDQMMSDALEDLMNEHPNIKVVAVCVKPIYQSQSVPFEPSHLRPTSSVGYPRFHASAFRFSSLGGIVFLNAGDHGPSFAYHDNNQTSYLNVVRGLDRTLLPRNHFDCGRAITFCAPAEQILCSDEYGQLAQGRGSKYATMLCAAVAAETMALHPGLTGSACSTILRETAMKFREPDYNIERGYGMPDAAAACSRALQYRSGIVNAYINPADAPKLVPPQRPASPSPNPSSQIIKVQRTAPKLSL